MCVLSMHKDDVIPMVFWHASVCKMLVGCRNSIQITSGIMMWELTNLRGWYTNVLVSNRQAIKSTVLKIAFIMATYSTWKKTYIYELNLPCWQVVEYLTCLPFVPSHWNMRCMLLYIQHKMSVACCCISNTKWEFGFAEILKETVTNRNWHGISVEHRCQKSISQ